MRHTGFKPDINKTVYLYRNLTLDRVISYWFQTRQTHIDGKSQRDEETRNYCQINSRQIMELRPKHNSRETDTRDKQTRTQTDRKDSETEADSHRDKTRDSQLKRKGH